MSYLLGLLLQQGSSVLITGTTGNGKTALVKDKLLELCSNTVFISTLTSESVAIIYKVLVSV